jgi:hypothetical protein
MLRKKASRLEQVTSQWAPVLSQREEVGPTWQRAEATTLKRGAKAKQRPNPGGKEETEIPETEGEAPMKKMGRKGGQKQGGKTMTKGPNGSEIKTNNLELSLRSAQGCYYRCSAMADATTVSSSRGSANRSSSISSPYPPASWFVAHWWPAVVDCSSHVSSVSSSRAKTFYQISMLYAASDVAPPSCKSTGCPVLL